MSKERRFTRREFLIGLGSLAGAAVLGSCERKGLGSLTKVPTKEPSKTSTERPTPTPERTLTPTLELTPTVEPTPTLEIVRYPGVIITEEYLKKTFAALGGEEEIQRPTPGAKETQEISLQELVEGYVSEAWGEKIEFNQLSDPVVSIKTIVALGSWLGIDQKTGVVFNPGERLNLPELEDLNLPRITLESVFTPQEQKNLDYPEYVAPLNLTLRPSTQMTIIGIVEGRQIPEAVKVDNLPTPNDTANDTANDNSVEKNDNTNTNNNTNNNANDNTNNQLRYALVAFTDYSRTSENGVPRHFFAVIPDTFPADPDNKNTFTLKNLLERNKDQGIFYDPVAKELVLTRPDQPNKQARVQLNTIQGEQLCERLRNQTGIFFVDKLNKNDTKPLQNPVVPFPEQMPAVWDIKLTEDEQGNFQLILLGQLTDGTFKEVFQASYDTQTEKWIWEPIPDIPKEEILDIEGLEAKWNQETQRWEYYDPKEDLLVGWWNNQEKRIQLDPNLQKLKSEWKGLYTPISAQEAEKLITEAVNKGEYRIPIPFDFTKGGELLTIRGDAGLQGFHNVSVDTVVYAPFEGKITKGFLQGFKIVDGKAVEGDKVGYITIYNEKLSSFCLWIEFDNLDVKKWEDLIIPEDTLSVKSGDPLVKFGSDFLLENHPYLDPNPKDFQMFLSLEIGDPTQGSHPLSNITLAGSLLFDNKGRVLYIGK